MRFYRIWTVILIGVLEKNECIISFVKFIFNFQKFLFNNTIRNKVDQATVAMYIEEWFGLFLFGEHNPYKSKHMNKEAMQKIILEKV